MFRRLAILFAAALGTAGLAACGSSSPASAPLTLPHPTTSAVTTEPPTFPATTPASAPVQTPAQTPVITPSSGPSSGSSGGPCPSYAKYCDQFADTSSGWPAQNTSDFFAQYDSFAGGTYRLGERTNATITEDAPLDITSISPSYGVKIEVDAIRNQTMPGGDDEGISCWEHPAKSGGGTAAFLFFFNSARVEIGLWDGEDGSYHRIAQKAVSLLHTDGQTADHLTADCIQNGDGSAGLAMSVNGQVVLSASYAHSVHDYEWDPANKVGLLAGGQGADVFYDNFAVS